MKIEVTVKVGSSIGQVKEIGIGSSSRKATPYHEEKYWIKISH
jgi:hypothetical protein